MCGSHPGRVSTGVLAAIVRDQIFPSNTLAVILFRFSPSTMATESRVHTMKLTATVG